MAQSDNNNAPEGQVEQYVALLTRYQPRIFMFICSLVTNRSDAEDVMQETSLVLWRRFADFQPGSDFRAWAFQVALHSAQSFWARQRRDRHVFSDDFLDRVSQTACERADDSSEVTEALAFCMEKLSDRDRELIGKRYGSSVPEAAEELGRSQAAIYKASSRIRGVLSLCIQRRMAQEEHE